MFTRLAGLCSIGVAIFPTTRSGAVFSGETIRTFVSDATGQDYQIATNSDVTGNVGFSFWDGMGYAVPILDYLHYLCASVLFLILYYFSRHVFTRPQTPSAYTVTGHLNSKKALRNRIYRGCGYVILATVIVLIVKIVFFRRSR